MCRVRFGNWISCAGLRIRRYVKTMPKPAYLNVGAGPRGKCDNHWLNVDGFRDRNVRYLLDFTRPLPLADKSISGAFCEHVLEHLSIPDAHLLLSELARVLEPGGVLRVIVPDAAWVVKMYSEQPDRLAQLRRTRFGTTMEAVNDYFRQRYEHQFLHDYRTMEEFLLAAGFREVRRASYAEGAWSKDIVLDDKKYQEESLYVEART